MEAYIDRSRGAFLGLATGDALGAPVEFTRRGEFPLVTDMKPGGYFNLPKGAWTDDTAMALCLADSLLEDPGLNITDLMDRFLRWIDLAENTSTGKAIGLGQNTIFVLGHYRRSGALEAPYIKGKSDGNGSIMRLAPIACAYWRETDLARSLAIKQSRATHASALASSACDFLALVLCELIKGSSFEEALNLGSKYKFEPEVLAIAQGLWAQKSMQEVKSGGFVIDTLEAACWCIWHSDSFESALIKAVNLGHDADTVAAVTGQIAGALYGADAIPKRWLDDLVQKDKILNKVEALMKIRNLK